MAYLTYEEFCAFPLGVYVDQAEFESLGFYAEAQIDSATLGRVHPDDVPAQVKKATAVQIAYLAQNGGADRALGALDKTSESIGSYSYSTSGASNKQPVCKLAREILFQTGLLYTGTGRRVW